MAEANYVLSVESTDQAAAGSAATALANSLRQAEGVREVERMKPAGSSMDVGTIVSVIATSGATLALAQGVAAWLRARRGVTLTIERHGTTDSLKTAVAGIDPETALRIVEMIRKE
jgi:hypothetical protein